MRKKSLEDIKHGRKVVDFMEHSDAFFVNDIERGTGLDNRSVRKVLTQLLKHGHVTKNDRGQWSCALDEPDELVVSEVHDASAHSPSPHM